MVEIRLDATQDGNIPQDIFLSVRVGETQKLSKLSTTRTYKFPSVEGRKFGKIEVFRRIGTCNVDVDPLDNDTRKLDIRCGADPVGVLSLQCAVEQAANAKKIQEPKKDNGKLKAAKDYLSKHGLEMQLSEAMQAVLRERPDAPAEFLAHRLLAACGKTAIIPQNQPKTGGDVVKVTAPAPPPVLPFKAYYGATFCTVDQSVFAKCYANFPRKRAPISNQQAAGREMVKAAGPPPPILPFKAYYGATFLPLDSSVFEQCYAKFPRKQAKPTTAAPVRTEVKLGVTPIRLMPSCGTWIGQLPNGLMNQKPLASSKQDVPVFLKPSVGTWMNHLPRRMRQLPAPEPPASAPAAAHLKPSVGTWLNRLPPKLKKLPQKKKFQLKPSVGTWLATIPPEDPEPPVTGVLLTVHARAGPAFANLGLPNCPFIL